MNIAGILRFNLALILVLYVCTGDLSCSVWAKDSVSPQNFSLTKGSEAARQSGVLIEQLATEDSLTVRVIPTALRIDKGNGLYYIVSKAPDWDIYVIFPKKKEISVVTNYAWCVRHELRPLTWAGALGKPLRQQSYTSKGDQFTKYFFGTTPVNSLYLQSGVGNQDFSQEKNRAEMVCLNFPGCGKSGPVISRLQSLPALGGLPLSAVRFRPGRPSTYVLKTKKLDCKAMINKNIFVVPTNLKSIKFDIGLLLPAGQAENTKDFFKEFL